MDQPGARWQQGSQWRVGALQHMVRQTAQRFLAGAGEEDPTCAEAFQRAQGHGVEVALQVFGRALVNTSGRLP